MYEIRICPWNLKTSKWVNCASCGSCGIKDAIYWTYIALVIEVGNFNNSSTLHLLNESDLPTTQHIINQNNKIGNFFMTAYLVNKNKNHGWSNKRERRFSLKEVREWKCFDCELFLSSEEKCTTCFRIVRKDICKRWNFPYLTTIYILCTRSQTKHFLRSKLNFLCYKTSHGVSNLED